MPVSRPCSCSRSRPCSSSWACSPALRTISMKARCIWLWTLRRPITSRAARLCFVRIISSYPSTSASSSRSLTALNAKAKKSSNASPNSASFGSTYVLDFALTSLAATVCMPSSTADQLFILSRNDRWPLRRRHAQMNSFSVSACLTSSLSKEPSPSASIKWYLQWGEKTGDTRRRGKNRGKK